MLVLTSFAVTLDELSAETSQVLLEEHAASASEQTSVAANATSSIFLIDFLFMSTPVKTIDVLSFNVDTRTLTVFNVGLRV